MSPYIKIDDREHFKDVIEEVVATGIDIPGELNYLITCICQIYQNNVGQSYSTHNEIIGVLECVKQEWYRKQTSPYEDKKESENGKVSIN